MYKGNAFLTSVLIDVIYLPKWPVLGTWTLHGPRFPPVGHHSTSISYIHLRCLFVTCSLGPTSQHKITASVINWGDPLLYGHVWVSEHDFI